MAGGTIAAAIIVSLVAAGSTTASIAAAELKSKGGYVAGVIINESRHTFTLSSFDANHGHWLDHPNHKLSSVADIIKMLRAEAELAKGGTPVNDQELLQYYRDHYIKHDIDQPFVKSAVTSMEMLGDNLGSEGLIRLQSDTHDADVYLLIRKIPLGDYGAGVSMIPASWVKDNGFGIEDDSDGSKFCKHIRESGNKGPSSFFSEGATVDEKNGRLRAHFAAAQTTTFLIQDA